ncbi:MAG: outer membrane beta-barrel protein [Ginsengibacter sp.]
MLRKICTTIFVIATFNFSTFAQTDSSKQMESTPPEEVKPGPTITGSIDAYYRFNFDDLSPVGGSLITNTNNFTSFTNSHNSFELGMASIKADHSFGKASATIDLGFGKRAEEFSYGNPDNPSLFAIKQAYLSYAVSDKFKLTMGKWATHVGYELVDAYLNRNYSMDYMFSYGPFSHTGLKADIGLGKKSALMLGVANTTDLVSTTSSSKYLIGQFSTATSNDKLKAYLNYQGSYADSGSTTQFDLVLIGVVTDKFSIGYNGTVQSAKTPSTSSNSWWGSALYFNLDPTSAFGITLRAEYFDNKKAVAIYAPYTSIFDITLSPNFKIGNLTIIPELRLDSGKMPIFGKNDGTASKSTVTGILAATYHF